MHDRLNAADSTSRTITMSACVRAHAWPWRGVPRPPHGRAIYLYLYVGVTPDRGHALRHILRQFDVYLCLSDASTAAGRWCEV